MKSAALLPLTYLLAATLLPAAEPAPAAGWATGVDVVLEGSARLRGDGPQRSAFQGLALAKVEYREAENADRGVRLEAYASVMGLFGRGPTERVLGDYLAASNIEGHRSARLYSWWLDASLGDWSLRAGALLADEEFAGTDGGGNFFNSALGWPAFLSANTFNTGPAFFVAAPGLRLQRTFGETAAWRVGIYDGDSFDSPAGDAGKTRHGLHYRLGGSQGWFVMSEATLTPPDSANRFKVGGWLHTADFDDQRDDADGRPFAVTGADPRRHRGNRGFYAAVERTLAGQPGEAGNIEAFVRGGFSPADRNEIGWAADAGIAFTGLIPARPADVAAFGIAHAAFGSRHRAHARLADPSAVAPDFEQVFEANYRFEISERLSVQPDLQFIRHPGGTADRRSALAFLLRVNATY